MYSDPGKDESLSPRPSRRGFLTAVTGLFSHAAGLELSEYARGLSYLCCVESIPDSLGLKAYQNLLVALDTQATKTTLFFNDLIDRLDVIGSVQFSRDDLLGLPDVVIEEIATECENEERELNEILNNNSLRSQLNILVDFEKTVGEFIKTPLAAFFSYYAEDTLQFTYEELSNYAIENNALNCERQGILDIITDDTVVSGDVVSKVKLIGSGVLNTDEFRAIFKECVDNGKKRAKEKLEQRLAESGVTDVGDKDELCGLAEEFFSKRAPKTGEYDESSQYSLYELFQSRSDSSENRWYQSLRDSIQEQIARSVGLALQTTKWNFSRLPKTLQSLAREKPGKVIEGIKQQREEVPESRYDAEQDSGFNAEQEFINKFTEVWNYFNGRDAQSKLFNWVMSPLLVGYRKSIYILEDEYF